MKMVFCLFLIPLVGVAAATLPGCKTTKIDGTIAQEFTNVYVPRPGFIAGNESLQTTAKINIDKVTATYWSNIDLRDSAGDEVDLLLFYGDTISDQFLGGSLSGKIGAFTWDFPGYDLRDYGVEGGLSYNGPFSAYVTMSQVLEGDCGEGNMIHGNISKSFSFQDPTGMTDSWALTPNGSFAFLSDDFYGAETGFSILTPGLRLSTQAGPCNLYGYVNHQFGFHDMENQTYFGVGISIHLVPYQ